MLPRIAAFSRKLIEQAPPGCRILEIGAGEGDLASSLADRGYEVVAIDRERRTSFPVVVTAFETFDARGATFDCVTASLVLHHVEDLDKTLDKAASLLRPEGIIAIDDYGWERLTEIGARRRWGDSWERELQAWRTDRRELHRSDVMLRALDKHFARIAYNDHAYFDDGAGGDAIAFTYFGRR